MPKVIVVVANGCPVCAEVKKKLAGNSQFEIIDANTSQKARELTQKFNITAVPTFLFADAKNGKICVLNDQLKVGKCIKQGRENGKKQ